jgi:hypothetical protein
MASGIAQLFGQNESGQKLNPDFSAGFLTVMPELNGACAFLHTT